MNKKFSQIISSAAPSQVGWGIFLLSLILFTIGTLNQQFGFGVEESRYILFAQKMLHTGITAFPLLRTEFYPDYPATYTILIYLFSLLGHQVTPFTAILPSALAAAWTLMLTYRLAALYSARWGIYAVLFALGTYEFLLLARLPSPDPIVAAVAISSFFILYRDHYTGRNNAHWALPLLFLGGFLIRGPLGIIIPAVVSCSFYLVENEYKRFVITALYSLLLLVICTVFLLLTARHVGGAVFAKQVFFMQAAGRVVHLGQRPFYYYFVNGLGAFALAFPIAVIVCGAHAKEILGSGRLLSWIKPPANAEYRLLRHLVAWVLAVFIVLSLSKEKHFRYVIAVAPALALLAGYGFISLKSSRLLHYTRRCLTIGGMLLPFIGLALVVTLLIVNRFWLPLTAYYLWATAILVALIVAVFSCKQLRQFDEPRRKLAYFAIGIATWLTLFIAIAEPIAEQQFTSIKPLIDRVETLRTADQQIVLYKMVLDREGLKFMALLDETSPPPFLMSEEELAQYNPRAIFISRAADYADLPEELKKQYKVLWQGKQARRSWVVFIKS
ncbi:hypothetical protein BH10PSE19_BH10PSE19_04750 [soil metagenome]